MYFARSASRGKSNIDFYSSESMLSSKVCRKHSKGSYLSAAFEAKCSEPHALFVNQLFQFEN